MRRLQPVNSSAEAVNQSTAADLDHLQKISCQICSWAGSSAPESLAHFKVTYCMQRQIMLFSLIFVNQNEHCAHTKASNAVTAEFKAGPDGNSACVSIDFEWRDSLLLRCLTASVARHMRAFCTQSVQHREAASALRADGVAVCDSCGIECPNFHNLVDQHNEGARHQARLKLLASAGVQKTAHPNALKATSGEASAARGSSKKSANVAAAAAAAVTDCQVCGYKGATSASALAHFKVLQQPHALVLTRYSHGK